MLKTLIAAFSNEGLTLVRNCKRKGMNVKVLDCFDLYHPQLTEWYGKDILQTQGRRTDVRGAVAREAFDVAVVNEDTDFVRTALITQSLREGGVRKIVVVTKDASKRAVYRRCGAHRVVIASSPESAWSELQDLIPSMATTA